MFVLTALKDASRGQWPKQCCRKTYSFCWTNRGTAARLNSSRGLVAWECAGGEACSGFRLLAKACRCFSSRRTTSTCSSVGVKDS